MGIPVIGGDTTGTIDSANLSSSGDLDDVGFLAGNNDDTYTISTGASYGTASINSSTGEWTYNVDLTNPAIINLGPGVTLTDTFVVQMVDADNPSSPLTEPITITITGPVCFVAGTLIDTPAGKIPVERIEIGDLICTDGGVPKPVRWVGKQRIGGTALRQNEKLRPVRITAGALGRGVPERDLFVSRQHRLLLRSKIAERMFGVAEVLIPAFRLISLPGIDLLDEVEDVTYVHLMFDEHEIVFAEGAPSESLFSGPEGLNALGPEAREELFALFPELADPDHNPELNHLLPSQKNQKELVERHRKNALPLLG